MKRTLGCVALFGWLMASGSLQAHHSLAGVYDMKAEKELSGTVASSKVYKSPRVADYRGQESGWHVNRVGVDTGLRHGARAARDRQDRTECPPHRGRRSR